MCHGGVLERIRSRYYARKYGDRVAAVTTLHLPVVVDWNVRSSRAEEEQASGNSNPQSDNYSEHPTDECHVACVLGLECVESSVDLVNFFHDITPKVVDFSAQQFLEIDILSRSLTPRFDILSRSLTPRFTDFAAQFFHSLIDVSLELFDRTIQVVSRRQLLEIRLHNFSKRHCLRLGLLLRNAGGLERIRELQGIERCNGPWNLGLILSQSCRVRQQPRTAGRGTFLPSITIVFTPPSITSS